MDQTSLTSLPTDIITNILSRLPVRTIISCQCVCKSLFQLVKAPEFANLHLSKSVPDLIICEHGRTHQLVRIFEFEDEVELDQHELHYVPVAKMQMPISRNYFMQGSVNGLLLMISHYVRPRDFYICNPITSEYIHLPYPERNFGCPSVSCFGVSKVTNQYKLVIVSQEWKRDSYTDIRSIARTACYVYTLGTGSWRSIPHYSSLGYENCLEGTFLKGNLHWLVSDLKKSNLISCFDLEMEQFKIFSPPPAYLEKRRHFSVRLAALGERLCLCDNNVSVNEIVIWVMKEYEVEKSWTKDFVIPGNEYCNNIFPLKVFRDGDILMLSGIYNMFYYSNKTKTTQTFDLFELQESETTPSVDDDMFEEVDSSWIKARLHVSSFISLKSFAMENVVKF